MDSKSLGKKDNRQMSNSFTDAELSAFLDEDLPQDRMVRIEQALRDDSDMQLRLQAIVGLRDAGVHSLGAIWRRHRLSCPSREQLGTYLLGVLDEPHVQYIRFHLETIGCRVCNANLEDLQNQSASDEQHDEKETRQRKYYQSSAGFLSDDG